MKSASFMKTELIRGRYYAIWSREITLVRGCEDELVINHRWGNKSILHRATNVKPIMFRVAATSETVIGDRVIRSIVNAAGNAFLAQINSRGGIEPLDERGEGGRRGWPFYAGDDVWRCTR